MILPYVNVERYAGNLYAEYPIPGSVKQDLYFAWHPVKTVDDGWKWFERVYWVQEEYLHTTTEYVGVYNDANQIVRTRSDRIDARSYNTYYITQHGLVTRKLSENHY